MDGAPRRPRRRFPYQISQEGEKKVGSALRTAGIPPQAPPQGPVDSARPSLVFCSALLFFPDLWFGFLLSLGEIHGASSRAVLFSDLSCPVPWSPGQKAGAGGGLPPTRLLMEGLEAGPCFFSRFSAWSHN